MCYDVTIKTYVTRAMMRTRNTQDSNTKHNTGWIDVRQTDRKDEVTINRLTSKLKNEYYYSVTAFSRYTNETQKGRIRTI